MNMLMIAPLCDSRGKIRYFIGAQVDVSGMVKECTDLESLQRLVIDQTRTHAANGDDHDGYESKKDEFQELSEMMNMAELDTVRRHGGRMHREQQEEDEDKGSVGPHQPRLLLKEPSPGDKTFNLNRSGNGRLSGVYQHVCPRSDLRSEELLTRPVPTHSSISFPSHPLCIAFPPSPRYTAVTIHE